MDDMKEISTLVLDFTERQIIAEYLPFRANTPPLVLSPAARRFSRTGELCCHLRGEPVAALGAFLHAADSMVPMSRTHIVFGAASDPFFPAVSSLPTAMRLLELLAARKPHSILIQTRSPLALLALPAIRAFEKSEVRLCIETLDEELARMFFPRFPRPAERLEAAQTLRSVGIPVSLQVGPAVMQGEAAKQLGPIVQSLSRLPHPVRVVPFARLLPAELPEQSTKELRSLMRASSKLHPAAHRFLKNELGRINPHSNTTSSKAA